MSTGADTQVGAARRQAVLASRAVGVAGLLAVALIFVPAVAGSGQEPGFTAGPGQVLAFFRSVSSPLAQFGSFVSVLGAVALLWFAAGLAALLREVEPAPAWRSNAAQACAVVLVALILAADWDAAALRAADLDPQVARFAFDVGNASFANAWVALGGFAVATGWIIVSMRRRPRRWLPPWLGWWAIASGTGLALCRAAWTNPIWFLPYALFWLWLITVSVLLLRRPAPITEQEQ